MWFRAEGAGCRAHKATTSDVRDFQLPLKASFVVLKNVLPFWGALEHV